jgi:RNA polymerase sigma-70 factor (ECF subfamily)
MSDDNRVQGGGAFPVTRWSLVVRAAGSGSEARRALGLLCEQYWPPLYRFLRRTGAQKEDAEDLLQGFLLDFIQRNDFKRADKERGRFRSYLLRSLKNFTSKERVRAKAKKRGGDIVHVPFIMDTEGEEVRYAAEPQGHPDPERVFHRDWAFAILDRSLARVKKSFASRQRSERFEAYMGFALGGIQDRKYEDAARRLGISVSLVKKGVGQLRKELERELRREISDTVDDPAMVDEELRFLLNALRE